MTIMARFRQWICRRAGALNGITRGTERTTSARLCRTITKYVTASQNAAYTLNPALPQASLNERSTLAILERQQFRITQMQRTAVYSRRTFTTFILVVPQAQASITP